VSETFNHTSFNFDDEVSRLEARAEELQEEIAEADDAVAEVKSQQLRTVQCQRKGAVWARDRAFESDDFSMWDEDVDAVTLGAPRGGAWRDLQDEMEAAIDTGTGTTSTLLIVDGSVDVPYIDGDMSEGEAAHAVRQLHPFFLEWADARVNDLLDPEAEAGNGNN
jgi:hypothetical protein